ncbi:MAG TPA: IPT/TIG domain-containing protein [Gemmatimonadales bacterium]|nr:IPT/TIG domain-containing protein [Gemmatimonadales bacterium]
MSARILVLLCVLAAVALPVSAATATDLVPTAAPHGARFIVAGSGLDASDLAVNFARAGGGVVPAVIVSRAPAIAEGLVPPEAINGAVSVTTGGSTIATFTFTVTADPVITQVNTIVASGAGREPLKGPYGNVAVMPNAATYVADTMHHQIAAVSADGTVTPFAGSGHGGLTDGPAATAAFRGPQGVAYDALHNLIYVADTGNNAIRRIASDGTVTTLAGSGRRGDSDGVGAAAEFTLPVGIAVDAFGNVYVTDTGNNRVKRITPAGVVVTLAGTGRPGFVDGPGSQAQFHSPEGIVAGADGSLYVADTGNSVIRKIANGIVTTIAGGARSGYVDGPPAAAAFYEPSGLAFDEGGSLIIADTKNQVIRKLDLRAGSEFVSTIAGSGTAGFVDGPAATAQFRNPSGVSVAGAVFISDRSNDALRIGYVTSQLSAIYPRRGKTAGGETLRLFGTGFVAGQTQILINGQPATNVTVVSSTLLLATTPAAAVQGAADVTVVTPTGTSTLPLAYFYIAPPTINSLGPSSGPLIGGTVVTISGTNFLPGETAVTFGSASALSVNVASSATLTAVAPPAAASGLVDLRVQTPGGSATISNAFLYRDPPVIDSFTPGGGQTGTSVTIFGRNFDAAISGNSVSFGGIAAVVSAASTTRITATVPSGARTGPIRVTTVGGTVLSATDFLIVSVDRIAVTPATLTLQIGQTQQLTATATMSDGTQHDVTGLASWSSANGAAATVTASGLVRGQYHGKSAVTATLSGVSGSSLVTVVVDQSIPPDPVSVAPQPDPSVAFATLADSAGFLFNGPTPIQRGVTPGAIDNTRLAVLRGHVLDATGAPLAGVFIGIHGQPELGYTISRGDGGFDLAVNGGGLLTIDYEKDGYLSAQRQIEAAWHDYTNASDVRLLAIDAHVTTINLASPQAIQVAQGGAVTDADGTRTAALFIPAGTGATLTFADGSVQQLSTLSVRATEYTVGAGGPASMPAALPASSGYTYAVELSADEAIAAGAAEVTLSQPIPFYLDNFLGFPVGTPVPAGYYDRTKGLWVPSDNGRVIKVLSISGGTATIDADGDGIADSDAALAALGITAPERQQLAVLYPEGKTLWRVRIPHFTPWDFNWPYGPPNDATGPNQPGPSQNPQLEDTCRVPGCAIQVQNRVVGERVEVVGSPFALHYMSDRVPAHTSAASMELSLSGGSVPASMSRIDVEVTVAGAKSLYSFAPAPNQKTTFTWDGRDAYGRPVAGVSQADVKLSYVYPAVYQQPSDFQRAFANLSGVPLTANRARMEISISQTFKSKLTALGNYDARSQGLGGWTLSVHHAYDPETGLIHLGDGRTQQAKPTVSTVAGRTCLTTQCTTSTGDGGLATNADVPFPYRVAAAPDGSLYILAYDAVRRVDPHGFITSITHDPSSSYSWSSIAFGLDGTVYLANSQFISRLNADGTTTVVLYTYNLSGGGHQPITVCDLAAGPDGSLYIADCSNHQIHRLGNDGKLVTIAGRGCGQNAPPYCLGTFAGDGGPATQAFLNYPVQLVAAPDGSLYFSDELNNRIRKISPGGIITTVAGAGCYSVTPSPTAGVDCNPFYAPDHSPNGDGTPALSTYLQQPPSMALGPDGSLYIQELGFSYTRRVSPDGIISTVLGTGTQGFSGDNGPSRAAQSDVPSGITIGPDGYLYVSDRNNHRIRRIALNLPAAGSSEMKVASADGDEYFVFDLHGRHLRTLNTLTGAVKYQFTYDGGWLAAVTDAFGNQYRVERSGQIPSAIVAPGGQRTTLAANSDGYLETITNPASEAVHAVYANGLLTKYTDAAGRVNQFGYNFAGEFASDTDALGTKQFEQTTSKFVSSATITSALGRTATYRIDKLRDGSEQRTNTTSSGVVTLTLVKSDGKTTTTYADGSTITTTSAPDARFGMDAPIRKLVTLRTPGGVASTSSLTQNVTLSNRFDPLSVTASNQTLVINGKTYTSQWDAGSRSLVERSPAGRQVTRLFDGFGRISSMQPQGVAGTIYSYDGGGRTASMSQGSRSLIFGYNAANLLSSITDPLSRTTRFDYDLAGRMTRQTLPDGRFLDYSYDGEGNITSITPPGRSGHLFTYNDAGLADTYTPPAVTNGGATQFGYNADHDLTRVTRPDGKTIDFSYDAGGRLSTLTYGGVVRTITFGAGDRVASVADSGTTLNYAYDGPLVMSMSWSGPVSGAINWTYNSSLRPASEAVGGSSVPLAYDNDGLLVSSGALTLTRDPQNGFVSSSAVGSVNDAYTYNSFGEVMHYAATSGAAQLYTVDYTRDAAGRISAKTETVNGVAGPSTGYEYDDAGRLLRVTSNGSLVTEYQYDANSNRTSVRTLSGTTASSYDDQDRLVAAGGTAYTFNSNGELASSTIAGQMTTFEYDSLGNMRKVNIPGRAVEYVVDGQNRRIGKKVGGALVQGWVYADRFRIAAQLDATNSVVMRFVYGTRTTVPDYMVKGGINYRIISDQLGSPRLVVNVADGSIAQRMEYDAFGSVTVDTNPGFQPFGFAGGLIDPDTGFVHFGARDYDPHTGRWTSKDPIGFAGKDPNLYGYVYGDPINDVDPFGLYSLDDFVQDAANFSAGLGDNLTFGGTRKIREWMGTDQVVNKCSGFYTAGEVSGVALSVAIGAGAGAEAAQGAARGMEWSHWIPNRYRTFLPEAVIDSELNGRYVTTAEHALNDPYRYRFMPRAWKDANPINPAWLRQWNRAPEWVKGAAAGAAYGAGSAAAAGGNSGCGGCQ